MRLKTLTVIHVICPLIIGGLIYVSFRSPSLRLFSWFEMTGLNNITSFIRSLTYPLKNHFPSWFYFSLPDGLWVYSFSSAIIIYWNNDSQKVKFWLLIPFITGILVEIFQGLKLFPGTFDFLDLFFSTLALLLSFTIIKYKFKQNEKTAF